jgi:acyl-coenzyme A synthetase/AMP-(fatty) acid ligase
MNVSGHRVSTTEVESALVDLGVLEELRARAAEAPAEE